MTKRDREAGAQRDIGSLRRAACGARRLRLTIIGSVTSVRRRCGKIARGQEGRDADEPHRPAISELRNSMSPTSTAATSASCCRRRLRISCRLLGRRRSGSVFTSERGGDGQSDLYRCRPDGIGAEPLVATPSNGGCGRAVARRHDGAYVSTAMDLQGQHLGARARAAARSRNLTAARRSHGDPGCPTAISAPPGRPTANGSPSPATATRRGAAMTTAMAGSIRRSCRST
jgi:hypothetical protein